MRGNNMKVLPTRILTLVLAGLVIACGRGASAPSVGGRDPALATGTPTLQTRSTVGHRGMLEDTDVRAGGVVVTFQLIVLGDLPSRASIYWFTRQTHDGQWPSGPAPFPFCGPGGKKHSTTGKACAGEGTVYTNTVAVEPEELLHYSYSATGLGRARALRASDTRMYAADTTVKVYGNLPVVPVGGYHSYSLGDTDGGNGSDIRETMPRSGRSPLYIQLAYEGAVNKITPLACDRPSFTDLLAGEKVRWRSQVSIDCSTGRQVVKVSNKSSVPVSVSFVALSDEQDGS